MFKLDDYFKELNFYKHFAETFSSEKKAEPEEKNTDKKTEEKQGQKKSKKQTVGTEQKVNNTAGKDSLSLTGVDTSSVQKATVSSDDIVVKKDEMISSKTVEIVNVGNVSKPTSKDSLLQKISGVVEEKDNKPFLNIEFWQSPLNYKGYKMSKYKLVIYGVNPADAFKLYRVDESIYFKVNSSTYKLDYTADFRSYEKVSDETILAKLK